MAEQRIHSNLGSFDTLTHEELSSSLWDHVQHSEMARLAGMKVIRFPAVTIQGNGSTLTLTQAAGNAVVGPDNGFVWEVQRLTVASSVLTDQAGYAVYGGSDSTLNSLHLIDMPNAPQVATVTPAVPASTTAVENTNPFPVTVVISGGTVTAVTVNGLVVGAGDGTYAVPADGTISVTYSSAPTWTWSSQIDFSGGLNVNRAYYPSKHSFWLYGGEQVYCAVFNSLSNAQYTMTGVALEVPAEMQGKIM